MKKSTLFLFIVIGCLLMLTGCSNHQGSSQEEAQFVVRGLPDFQEQILYLSVESGDGFMLPPLDPRVYETDLLLGAVGKHLIHEIIYRTTDSTFVMVLLDDHRPPKIVGSTTFK